MNRSWLLLDANFLAWRSFYSVGKSLDFLPEVGTLFGFFKQVKSVSDQFMTEGLAFCFDHGFPKRRQVYQEYKSNRKPTTPEKADAKALVDAQLDRLRTELLPALGFANVFWRDGYEADDVIASIATNLPVGDSAVIVSSDRDLFQLVNDKVSVWNPNAKRLTEAFDFKERHGVEPGRWAEVKAIAGCDTDAVAGIRGVGELTACKFLNGQLAWKSAAHGKIVSKEGVEIKERNLPLVKLPYEGVGEFKLEGGALPARVWKKAAEMLGVGEAVEMMTS